MPKKFASHVVLANASLCFSKVLYFCIGLWELSHLTRDLSQAEKKKMLLQAEQMHKMTSVSLKMPKVVILSENSCHFVICSA